MFRLVAEHMFVGCDVGKHFVVGLGQMLALIGASHLQWGAVLNMLHKVPHGQHHQLERRSKNDQGSDEMNGYQRLMGRHSVVEVAVVVLYFLAVAVGQSIQQVSISSDISTLTD